MHCNVLLALAAFAASPAPQGNSPSTVSATLSRTPKPGETIDVAGYVTNMYACPRCPPGAQCKPCQDPYVYLADEKENPKALLDLRFDPGSRLSVGQRVRITGSVAGDPSMPFPPRTELKLDNPKAAILDGAGPIPAGVASVAQTLDRVPRTGSAIRVAGTLAVAYAHPCPKGQTCKPDPGAYFELTDQDPADKRRLVFRFQPPEGFAQGQRIRVSGKIANTPWYTELTLGYASVEVLDSGK